MKRFLVLGIGPAQVDLLRRLQGRYQVHACSNTDQGPGRELADAFALIDIGDRQAVCAYARQHAIDLVYSVGSDLAMPTACWVSEQLDLPRLVSSETAAWCQNKIALRQRLADTRWTVPFQSVADVDQPVQIPYPLIMKPADSQGQRGVIQVNGPDEYRVSFPETRKHSRAGRVILEQRIPGAELSAHALVKSGEVIWSLVSDRISWPQFPGGIIHQHILPSSLELESQQQIRQLMVDVVRCLGIDNGPAYFQIKMDGPQPRLIEVTPRLDGCHLWNLIRHATGLDLLDITLRALEDGTVTIRPMGSIDGVWTLEFLCAPPGTQFDSARFDLRPDAVDLQWYYDRGEVVRTMNGFMEKCGYQIFRDTP